MTTQTQTETQTPVSAVPIAVEVMVGDDRGNFNELAPEQDALDPNSYMYLHDKCDPLKIRLRNTNPAVTREELSQRALRAGKAWNPMEYELRNNAVAMLIGWVGRPTHMLQSDPVMTTLHGGVEIDLTHANDSSRLSPLFSVGEYRIEISSVQLKEADQGEWLEWLPDSRSFRVKNPGDKTKHVVLLYHQDPKLRKEMTDPSKPVTGFFTAGDEDPNSPKYWQPLLSAQQGAFTLPIKPGRGRTINTGMRDETMLRFNWNDIKIRILIAEMTPLGVINLTF
jgi:hypothetical protein